MSSDDEFVPQLIDTTDLQVEVKHFDPVPVTIVTGYLGSGKSTLLKHILQTNNQKRIALILNEFGETSDIEKSLNIRSSGNGQQLDQWIELDNGCMCCTAKDSGVTAIEKLMEREGRYDYIIIETSGVADPAKIAEMFWLDDALQSKVKLDAVVTVVDASTISKTLSEGDLASMQIACGDVLLINKCDLVSDEQVNEIETALHDINGAAPIIHASYGKINSALLLDQNAYTKLAIESATTAHSHSHNHNPHHNLSTKVVHLNKLSTTEFDEIEQKIQHILWEDKDIEVHRLKGKLQLEKETKIVQGVRQTYEIVDVQYEPEAVCKLVFIGKNLNKINHYL